MCKRTVDKQEYNVAGSLRLVDIFVSVTLACDLKSGEVKGQGHQHSKKKFLKNEEICEELIRPPWR